MIWLLILFCLAVAVSPLLWMKSSPRQLQITQFRKLARELGINVNLHKRPEARESEKRLDCMFYWLPWRDSRGVKPWVLHRHSNRGWQSNFQGWRWVDDQADILWATMLAETLNRLPSGATAIIVTRAGVGVIWDERGETPTVHQICDCVEQLRKKGEEIYL
jgi:hypothetical protein